MDKSLGKRAVVVGAGIGGLSAAGVLSEYFEQIVLLERDPLTNAFGSRPGTPQDRHSHGLLAGGLQAIGEIFPGFELDLAAVGAVPVKMAREARYERADVGVLPQRDFDQPVLCASRPLIEAVLRRRVLALSNVGIRRGCRVRDFRPTTHGGAALAVQFDMTGEQPESLDADLVVDASGRGSLTLELFDRLGHDRPEATEIGVDISYATVVIRMPADAPDGWKVVLTLPDPPHQLRHAVLLPIEDRYWTVTIAEHGGGLLLGSWEAFLEVASTLNTPTIYNALRRVERPDGIRHYGFPASVWRHFERLPQLPRGILPIGDALCRFNPIYGQGMSSAAKQASLLSAALAQSVTAEDPLAAAQAAFMGQVGVFLQTPWGMCAIADFAYPGTRGEKPEDFEEAQRFEKDLFRAVMVDPVVHRAVLQVSQLLAPRSLLQEPEISRRIEAVSASAAA